MSLIWYRNKAKRIDETEVNSQPNVCDFQNMEDCSANSVETFHYFVSEDAFFPAY